MGESATVVIASTNSAMEQPQPGAVATTVLAGSAQEPGGVETATKGTLEVNPAMTASLRPEEAAIDEAISAAGMRGATAQAQKAIVVPASVVAAATAAGGGGGGGGATSSQTANAVAEALGIPLSIVTSTGGAATLRLSATDVANGNLMGGARGGGQTASLVVASPAASTSAGGGGEVTLVPVLGPKRVLMLAGGGAGGGATTQLLAVQRGGGGGAGGAGGQQTVFLPQQPQAAQQTVTLTQQQQQQVQGILTAGDASGGGGTILIQRGNARPTTVGGGQQQQQQQFALLKAGGGVGGSGSEQLVAVSAGDNIVAVNNNNNNSHPTGVLPTRVVILPQHPVAPSADQVQQFLQQTATATGSQPPPTAETQQTSVSAALPNQTTGPEADPAAAAANSSVDQAVAVATAEQLSAVSASSSASAPVPAGAVTVTVGAAGINSSGNTVMIDASNPDATKMFDPSCSYTTLTSPHNGRMTPPCYVSNSYATLTPLQPLPPISTISSMQDKFQAYSPGSGAAAAAAAANVAAGTFVMQNNLPNISLGSPYNSYEKLGMSPPPYHAAHMMSGQQPNHSPSALSPQGIAASVASSYSHSNSTSKQEPLSPGAAAAAAANYYSDPARGTPHDLSPPHSIDAHSPADGQPVYPTSQAALTSGNNPSLNGMASISPHAISPVPAAHHSPNNASAAAAAAAAAAANRDISPPSPPNHSHNHPAPPPPPVSAAAALLPHLSQPLPTHPHPPQQTSMITLKSSSGNNNNNNAANAASSAGEGEEINTKELAQRISAELKRYSIPQAIFAQRVLCRSQGTLSDLLRNPKPWSKLKSGRETFRRMAKWLQEPEFQRMSALRLAGMYFFYAINLLRTLHN